MLKTTAMALGYALLGACPALAANGCAGAQPPSVEKSAILKVEQLVANAQTPAEGLSTFDDHALQDDFFPPQRHGKAQIMQDFQVYMDNYTSFHADILDMTIDTRCDLAVAYSHQHFTAAGRAGKPKLDAVVRQTDVLHKEAGKWLIVYQHLSVPIDIHTGQAVWKP
jgi:ketosteroid isomerase-like protein